MLKKLLVLVFAVSFPIVAAQAEYRLTKDDIFNAVRQEFIEQGMGEDIEVEVFGGKTDYYFEQAEDAEIMLSNLNTDAKQDRFTVEAEIFADGVSADKTKLTGRYYQVVKAWVPAKDITKEKVLQVSDLQETKIRANRLKGGAWYKQEDIIGKQATKTLKAGKLIEKGDLQAEVLVKKGQAVTVVYTKKGLQITSKMQALDNAASGETVKLLNLGSKKEIVGTVKGAGLVEISNE